MKILAIHSDYLKFEPKKKAIESAEELKGTYKEVKECLVVFTAVEKKDESNAVGAAQNLTEEIGKISEQVKTKTIVLYPYAHLSPTLSSPDVALKVMKDAENLLKNKGYDVTRAPFGWYKAFEISCKGHPLSELSREFGPEEAKEEVSEALKAEKTLKSYWHILDLDGNLVDTEKFDFSGYPNLKKFSDYEKSKVREVSEEPPHINYMRRLELVDYEPASDSGHLRYYPKGRLIKKLLETFVTDRTIEYGGVEVETPLMYDLNHPTMKKYLQKFPARQYQIESDKRTFFLRFSACFGQFLMAHDATLSYRNLPLKLYELTRYSFRREQSGEVTGLRRLRAFTMPDVHAICEGMDQALEEFKVRFELVLDTLESIGFDAKDDFEIAVRFTRDFYEKNREFVKHLVKRFGKPALIEMWDERKFYFELKYELNFVDNLDKASALPTDQIDVENGERYGITFVDRSGTKRHPIILHCSPSGAIERVIYALLEKAKYQEKKGKKPSLPLWLCPTQVRLIPLSPEKHLGSCEKLADELSGSNIRVNIDDNTDSVGKRIRNAETEWVPYILVIGDKEANLSELRARIRNHDEMSLSKKDLINAITTETKGMPFKPLPLPRYLSRWPKFFG